MEFQNFKLTLEYNGAAFYGFQRQPHHKTVQEVLEEALSKLFNQPLKISSASSRTDSGVHARSQIVNFSVKTKLNLFQIQNGLNRYLPYEVSVMKVESVAQNFHARFSAKSKTYEYRVWNHKIRSPLYAATSMHVPYDLNLTQMKKAAKILCGKHDFKAFSATDSGRKNNDTVRTIYRLEIKKRGNLIQFKIEADGFLYHMVRNLIGTLLDVGREKTSVEDIRKILKSKDRKQARATAQAQGLCLIDVTY